MELNGKNILLCNCEETMPLDGAKVARGCAAAGATSVHTHLCRREIARFRDAVGEGKPLLVACTQEAPLFAEIAAEAGAQSTITYANIRERAGWSEEADRALPKIAALLAEATLDAPPVPTVAMRSEGVCLVYGRDETAIELGRQLAARLDVTVLLSQPKDVVPPRVADVPIFRGTIVGARGHLGAFELTVDGYAPVIPSSRGALRFDAGRSAATRCDLILDVTGGSPLFPAAKRREGYFSPDTRNPAAVQRALFDLVDLVGEFDKPRYVEFKAEHCAHSRNGRVGCTRCLDVCPASAIAPAGDVVAIDPFLCGGCGACHSVCPTGAAAYALPPIATIAQRLRLLLSTYRQAGGDAPVLLIHDGEHGEDLLAAMARRGRGLPARVLPFAVNAVTQIGLDTLATAMAYGAAQIVLLVPPARREELQGLAAEIGTAEALLVGLGYGSGRVEVLIEADPDTVEAALHGLRAAAPASPASYAALGDKRGLTRFAVNHLRSVAPQPADTVLLPAGASFGAVRIDAAGCTLCLACVGVCPTGALQDNPERPELRFQEEACVQCGLCKATCPEKVITLEPRLDFTEAARRALVLKEEEPFECVRCGRPFGTRSTVERVLAKLADKHAMFMGGEAIERIKMCDDCRIKAQFETRDQPLAGAARPLPRTTDDHLREREIEEARARLLAERRGDKPEAG
jgi:ferredoxin